MARRLIIDLDACDGCDRCGVGCKYFYRARPEEHGVLAIRERATYELVCRRCEEPSCIAACPFGALERGTGGVLRRHNLRCVSCKLCVNACPFGTIYPDMLTFYVTPCDYCLRELSSAPPCARSCSRGAIQYRTVDPEEPGLHLVDDGLAALATRWVKREEGA